MSNHDDDNNLDEYLSGNSELSKLYGESTDSDMPDMPGMDLDNSILAAAKREVVAGPQKSKKTYSPFSNNYFIPLSTAASMLIVVAVVSFFPNEQVVEQSLDLSEADMEIASITSEQQVTKPQEQIIIEAKSRSYSAKLNAPETKSKKKLTRKAVSKTSEKIIKLRLQDKRSALKKEQQDVMESQRLMASKQLAIKADRQRITETEALSQDSVVEARSADSPPALSPATESTSIFAALAVNSIEYNEKQWNKYSETEWLTRIRKIHRQRGGEAVKEIIVRFKEKFPESKIDFKKFISDSNKK